MAIKQQLNYTIKSINKTSDPLIESITLKTNNYSDKSMYVVHRALVNQLNNKRQGNACTKTKGEVRGGGRKPWKQKGTGRARAGSIRSPLRKGGGVIFGPKPKIYTQKINKKENQLAIRNIIINKFKITTAVDCLISQLDHPNTKEAKNILANLGLKVQNEKKILIITEEINKNIYLSIKNLKNVMLINVHYLNTVDLLNATCIVVTQKSLRLIEQIYG